MHIQFKKIRYKNILSVGNNFIEISLDKNHTTLISGNNGSGKSTIIEAIVFALFNKTFRKINKPQLINSINKKDLLVELEFSISKDKYLIRRGIKPTIFEIWKNDELLNKDAASRDYQEYLEQNIIKMSLKSFTQIVILGSASYVPFMELPAGQRREIIEDLLDIQIFSVMNQLLKEKISENKNAIIENDHQIELLTTKLNSARNHNAELERLKQSEVGKLKKKISDILSEIERNKEEISVSEDNIKVLSEKTSDKKKNEEILDQIRKIDYDLKSKDKKISEELEFYSRHDDCPTCKQALSVDFKNSMIENHRKKKQELKSALEKLIEKKKKIDQRLSEISEMEKEKNSLQTDLNERRISTKMLMTQLRSIKNDLQQAEKEVKEIDQSEIEGFTQELSGFQNEQTELHQEREMLSVVSTMLKDGGIKTSIVKTYIPIMNKFINRYLSEFELFVDFTLDENFNEVIKSRFRDTFSFASFSEGEKLRISLSIMFTWRAIAKLRNSVSTNLLFLDETLDGSSDSSGVESLIDILHKLNDKDNIFVISHRGMMYQDKFQNHIQFEKSKNFTQKIC